MTHRSTACFFLLYFAARNVGASEDVQPTCRERFQPINSNGLNLFELVEAYEGDTVVLDCHFCNVSDNKASKIWFRQDASLQGKSSEVTLGTKYPLTSNRVYVTPWHTLVIQHYQAQDEDAYQCRGLNGEDAEDNYNFLVQTMIPNPPAPFEGNLTQYAGFRQQQLAPLSQDLRSFLDNDGPDVTTHWGPWGPCLNCSMLGKGLRSRRGYCRLFIPANLTSLPPGITMISCRSPMLYRMPIFKSGSNLSLAENASHSPAVEEEVQKVTAWESQLMTKLNLSNLHVDLTKDVNNTSVIVQDDIEKEHHIKVTVVPIEVKIWRANLLKVPEFRLIEECDCIHEEYTAIKRSTQFHRNLYEGEDLTLICPRFIVGSRVVWKKGRTKIPTDRWLKMGKKAQLRVDLLGNFHLQYAEPRAAGHYSCRTGKKTSHFNVTVVSIFQFSTEEYRNHQLFLFGVIFVCFVVYLLVLFTLWLEPPEVRAQIMHRPSYGSLKVTLPSTAEEEGENYFAAVPSLAQVCQEALDLMETQSNHSSFNSGREDRLVSISLTPLSPLPLIEPNAPSTSRTKKFFTFMKKTRRD